MELGGGATGDDFQSIAAEDHFVVVEEVLGVDFRSRHEEDFRVVPSGEVGLFIECSCNDEDFRGVGQTGDSFDERLGLAICNAEAWDHENVASFDPLTEGFAEGELLGLAVDALKIVTWERSEDDTTTGPNWGAALTSTGAASAFLTPWFFVAAGNFTAALGAGGSGAAVGAHRDDDVVNGLGAATVFDNGDVRRFG